VRDDARDAFEQFCREEYGAVVRTAYLITGDREEAVDVAQEAFARAYERWRTVRAMKRPGGWVQRVAANLSLSWRRRRAVRARPWPAEPNTEPTRFTPQDPEIIQAVLSLPQAQRAAVVLRYFADQSVEEVARALGKKPGTIRALTSQGVARLRQFLPVEEVHDEVH
jgi:RNA polymerase sigma-70 factor (sigma-E family)